MIPNVARREASLLALDRLRWRLMRTRTALGLPVTAGVVVLLAALWVTAVDIPRVLAEVRQVKQTQAATAVSRAEAQQAMSDKSLPAATHLYEQRVDPSNRLPAVILASLRDSGLNVSEISMAENAADSQHGSVPIRQRDLSIVAEGSYPALRRGLDTVMREHPSLAMTSVTLSSETARAATRSNIQASIRMRYYPLPSS